MKRKAERSAPPPGRPARRQLRRTPTDAQLNADTDFDPLQPDEAATTGRCVFSTCPAAGHADSRQRQLLDCQDRRLHVEAPSDVYTPEETEDILNGDLPLTGLPSFDF
ncbi:MAG: hypothetical protein ACLUFV_05985 [Acutalibacteraceae bacterium]